MKLANRVALVTGASEGIGLATAKLLARRGATVAICARKQDKLDRGLEELQAIRADAEAHVLDVSDSDACSALIEDIAARHGRLDMLVNNAQEVPLGTLDDVTDEAFVAGFESGPLASLRLMKLARPHMAARGGGTMFNLASSAGIRWDMTGYGAYGAIKQATRVLTRAAAAEWGREGIRVLTIAPHAESPGLKWWIENNPEEAKAFFKTIPLGRIGQLEEDIGRAIVGLCSPDMGYLTGATIPLDGGLGDRACRQRHRGQCAGPGRCGGERRRACGWRLERG